MILFISALHQGNDVSNPASTMMFRVRCASQELVIGAAANSLSGGWDPRG
jgi:hypothetical protein